MAPILFTVPGLDWQVQSYGLFMGIALVVGWIVALALARRDRLPTDVVGTTYVVGAAVGVLAARGGFLLQHPQAWQGAGSLLVLEAAGLAPFFGIATALAVTAVLAARRRVPPSAWFDVIAPAFAVGAAIESIGALLAGTAFGRYAPGFALAIEFPVDSPAFVLHQQQFAALLPQHAQQSLPVHPTQIYALGLAIAAAVLCAAVRRRRSFAGQVFLACAGCVVAGRTLVEEWFRADAQPPVLWLLNPSQVTAVVLLAGLAAVYAARRRRADRLRLWEGGRWSPAAAAPATGRRTAPASGARPATRKGKRKGRG